MKYVIIILLILPIQSFGQDSTNATRLFGFTFSVDQAFNFPDKAIKSGLAGKLSVGVSLTNKKRQFVLFAGGGIKGGKFTLYSARFRESFLTGIEQNYSPINGHNLDSLVAVKMNGNPGRDFKGTYSQYLNVGIMLNSKFRPILQFYVGREQLLLHDDSFTSFVDPEYSDIDYVRMNTTFYEIKAGIALPIRNSKDNDFCFVLNAGYKGVNYGAFEFNNTPLNSYTNQSFADQFRFTGKFTLSVGFIFWSNW